ncbi:MAG TPA: hypothetical protein VNH18_19740 [Bryobacteraceae bacterium]|nr:hypothetical protein [Bryobacteraceae bacterium]
MTKFQRFVRAVSLTIAATFIIASPGFCGQSAALSPAFSTTISIPPAGVLTSLGSTRLELRLHSWSLPTAVATLVSLPGMNVQLRSNGELCATDLMDNLSGYGPWMCADITGSADVTIRVQRDVTNMVFRYEVWSTSDGAPRTTYCGTLQVTNNGNLFPCPISSVNLNSWAGSGTFGGPGLTAQIAWLKWSAGIVPPGSAPSAEYAAADLADWRFEGNLQNLGSAGYAVSIDSAPGYSNTPVFAPVCRAGARQTFRAGFSSHLDSNGSYALDGGSSLAYSWQQLSGPSTIIWSNALASQPSITGLIFGSYALQLTVTDSSGQSTACSTKIGAVASDQNGTVIVGNPAVDTLLGPLVRYGANPWPWYDDRNAAAAALQTTNLDAYYNDYWNVAGPGTITVSASSTRVTGVGTTFTSTFCTGGSVPRSGASVIVWYPTNNPLNATETGRRLMGVASCESDTQLTLQAAWFSDTPAGSFLNYTEQDSGNLTMWSYNAAPANYYDNVMAFYSLYYRTGIDDYLIAARKLADRFWTSPQVDRGAAFTLNGSGTMWPARSASMLGMVLRALDGRPEMWSGLHKVWDFYKTYLSLYDITFGVNWDLREQSYHLAMVSYCALYDGDPGYRAGCKNTISQSFATIWTPFKFPDGSWSSFYYTGGWASWDTKTTVTLTQGSASVTASGASWSSSQTGALVWFTGSGTIMPSNNAAGDTATYTGTVVDATHLTLDRPYEGTSGSHGWVMSNLGFIGWGAQPYMMGIMSTAFDFAASAIADTDPGNSALARSYGVTAANWVKTYGYWPQQKGLYYAAQTVNCQVPISDSNVGCTSGNNASQARTLSAEAIRGVGAAYLYSGDPALRTFGDTLYAAMFSKPGTGGLNPDGYYVSDLDDGSGTFMTGRAAPKWFGVFFGFGDGAAWPGARLGGVLPETDVPASVTFDLTVFPGAVSALVSATAPNGITVQTTCTSSPCSIMEDSRQGEYVIQMQYLSATGATVGSTSVGVPLAQTITFAALSSVTMGISPITLSATASSGLTVSFSSATPAVCTLSGNLLTIAAAGTCSVAASQAGNAGYAAATPVTRSFTVLATQTITFVAPGSVTMGNSPITLQATASSGLTVGFSSDTPAVCTVSGNILTMVAAGTCSVTASQAGNTTYAAAIPVAGSFTVLATQTITFAAPTSATVGESATLGATASSGLTVSFTSTTPDICTVAGNIMTPIARGTCTITARQAGNAVYAAATSVMQSIRIRK